MSSADLRSLVHVAAGLLALTLAWLSAAAAAAISAGFVAFNLAVLPRLAGGRLRRAEVAWGPSDRGLVLYPVSVLVLLLLLPDRPLVVACAWALLAFGDGAAGLVGRRARGRRLAWNRDKSLAGSLAFALAGGAACGALAAACAVGLLPFRDAGFLDPSHPALWWWGIGLIGALVAGVVESLPSGLDDNLTVAWSGAALFLGLFALPAGGLSAAGQQASRLWASSLALSLSAGIAAYWLRQVSFSGLVGGVAIGTIVGTGLGRWGLALLVVFFITGSAATQLGLSAKRARALAEAASGARGSLHALAKGSVPALCALLALGGAPRASCALAFCAALAAAAFDTVASEIGKWIGGPTLLTGTLRRVPPGTPGGVSVAGTLAGAAAGALIAALAVTSDLVDGGWGAGVAIWIGAWAGSFSERPLSLLGSRGRAHPAALNLFNTLIGAAAALSAARLMDWAR
jgi:uncharacterized protein (TIGR00297 family)